MNIRVLPVLLFLSTLTFTELFAQSCLDEIQGMQIPEKPNQLGEEDELYIDFLEKTHCFIGETIDSVDLEIAISPAYLTMMLMLEKMENDGPISYGRLYDIFVDFTRKDDYPKIKGLHLLTREYETKPALYANWKEDKQMLIDLGIPEEKIEPFENYLKEHPNSGKSYQELMIQYEISKMNLKD